MKALSFLNGNEKKRWLPFKINHGSSFTRFFLFLSTIGVLFSVLSVSYIYLSTRESIVNNVQDSRVMTTNQIKNTFEREIQTIEKSFNAYSTTNDFYEMVQQPMRIQDFRRYREINSMLNYFATFSLEGTVYSLVSMAADWRVESGTLHQMTEDQMAEFEAFYIEGRNENLYWVRGENSVISVSLLPFFSRDKLAVGLAEIPNRSINSLLEVSSSTTPFFIVNRNDEVIYSANLNEEVTELPPDLVDEIRLAAVEQPAAVLDSVGNNISHSRIIYTKSDYNNWLYVTYLDESEINQALAVTKYGLIVLALILIVGSIFSSYLVAGRFTKPIETLKNSLAFITGSETKKGDDWDFISQGINKIVTENESLQNLYDREKPELKKQFMSNLYRNQVMEIELEHKIQQLGFPTTSQSSFAVMLIQIDEYGQREAENKDIFLISINEMVRDIIPNEIRFTPVVLNNEVQVTLLAFDNDDLETNKRSATEYADAIIESLQNYMNLSVSVAFSPFFTHLLEAKDNLERGYQALSYHLLLDKQTIIFYDEIEKTMSVPEISEYPETLEANLLQEIRLGEVDKVKATASELLDTLISSSNLAINVQVALLRLSLNLVQLSQTMNSEFLSEERGIRLYEEILQSHDFVQLKFFIQNEVILPFAEEMCEKNAQQFQRLSEQIIEMIEEDYMEDITLEVIGTKLHYNPNYLSNIFKKETGITFSDYLTSYRFEIAKKWLRETDVTIKEISERLQYRNPQNFIRSFKKKENMTPGEYRKMHTPT